MRRTTALLLALAASATISASSQQDSAASRGDRTYVETFEVRVQNLDLIVTNRGGEPVSGLLQKDFVLLENGVEQEISNFAAYDENPGVARRGGAEEEIVAVPPPPRKVVFFIDQMSLHPDTHEKLADSAMHFLESLEDHDEAMVVAAIGQSNVVERLTTNRAAIRTALDRVLSRSAPSQEIDVAQEIRFVETQLRLGGSREEIRELRRQYADMVRRRVTQRLGMLRALTAALSRVRGKKVLVLISPSLESQPGLDEAAAEQTQLMEGFTGATPGAGAPGQFLESVASPSTIRPSLYDLRPLIADLGRTAAASGVTIYPLQPDVPLDLMMPGSVETGSALREREAGRWNRMLENNERTMITLAESTGGRWFRGDDRIDDVFRQIGDDVGSYYSVGYHVRGEKNRPREIVVRVKNRPDLSVRTRSDVQEKSVDREMTDLTMAALLYSHPVNELSVRVTAGKPEARLDVFSIPVEVQIPMHKLTFVPTANDRYAATFRVHYATAGDRRDFVAGEQREQTIDLSAQELRDIGSTTFRYSADMVVTKGTYRIAVGVYDATSHESGFAMVRVQAQ